MAEIKIKIDSSDIDAAIAKVSHLLELVERLPAGLLGTESEAAPAESVKVFINEAFINKKDIIASSISGTADSIIKSAIDNKKDLETPKNGESVTYYAPAFLIEQAPCAEDLPLEQQQLSNGDINALIRTGISTALRPGGSIWQALNGR